MAWHSRIRRELPCWEDYLTCFERLGAAAFPSCEQLDALLEPAAVNGAGRPLRFVEADRLDATPYEQQIWESGRVATRPGSWHDLFNALVWARFPRIKSAMNALHHEAMMACGGSQRGPVRDALTLFDECGAVVFSADTTLLGLLAQRSWREAFSASKSRWRQSVDLCICGHALLEKCLSPYKSMTANALLVQLTGAMMALDRSQLLRLLDERLAAALMSGDLLNSPSRLSPLPLAGVPGWWHDEAQDDRFYADRQVFRPAPRHFAAPPLLSLV